MTTTLAPFAYPPEPHTRKHGPRGYPKYQRYKPWLRDEFTFRCVYCLIRERWFQLYFTIDHAMPRSRAPERLCDYGNLLYACSMCNSFKQDVLLPDPCNTAFASHVRVNADGSISAISSEGKRLVRVLQLDRPKLTEWRARLLRLLERLALFGDSAASELKSWFGFPDDLPNLRNSPPEGNDRPDGIAQSYYEQNQRGELADCY